MNVRPLPAITAVGLIALLVWFQQCQQGRQQRGGQSDVFGALAVPCGDPPAEITYTGRSTTVIVKVLKKCSDVRIEYEEGRQWKQLTDGVGQTQVNPEENSAYAVTVARNKKIRLVCAQGEVVDTCRFELVNATTQPASGVRIVDTTSVSCGAISPARFYNYSATPINVLITWVDVCKNPHSGGPRPATPEVFRRVIAQNIQPQPAPEPVNRTGSTATWRGSVNRNIALEVRCPGTLPECKFFVNFVR